MTAFEVSINGHRVCVAGTPGAFSLSANVQFYTHKVSDQKTRLHVHGMDRPTSDWLVWTMPSIGVGSEVSIRIVEVDAADTPDVREVHDAAKSRAEFSGHIRRTVEMMPLDEARRLVDELTASVAAREAVSEPSH